jgi:hypothetical protein
VIVVYDLGDVVPLTVDIRDVNGALANASAVTLTITLPDGTSITPAVASPSTGRYQLDYQTTQVGRHSVRWVATGSNASAYTDSFDVRPTDPSYIISLATAKAALNIPGTETGDDEEIRALIEAVTMVIESYRSEAIVRRAVTEQIWVYRARSFLVTKAPVISLTSVSRVFDGYTWPIGDLMLRDAEIGEVSLSPYGLMFSGDLTVSYMAGRSIVPANYTEAAKIILKHLWQTQQTPGMGSRVFGGGGEDVTVGLAGLGFAIPNRAAELLGGRAPAVA